VRFSSRAIKSFVRVYERLPVRRQVGRVICTADFSPGAIIEKTNAFTWLVCLRSYIHKNMFVEMQILS
jgi:hypothetical protein